MNNNTIKINSYSYSNINGKEDSEITDFYANNGKGNLQFIKNNEMLIDENFEDLQEINDFLHQFDIYMDYNTYIKAKSILQNGGKFENKNINSADISNINGGNFKNINPIEPGLLENEKKILQKNNISHLFKKN